jgi:hypothetical protein
MGSLDHPTQLYLRTFCMLFLSPPPPPGGDPGGSGLLYSFRNKGFGPDPGRGDFYLNLYFDLKYSWVKSRTSNRLQH